MDQKMTPKAEAEEWASLEYAIPALSGFDEKAPWAVLTNKHLGPACTKEEYKGNLGVKKTADDCLKAIKTKAGLNYAIWRGDGDKACHVCAITARGADCAQYQRRAPPLDAACRCPPRPS